MQLPFCNCIWKHVLDLWSRGSHSVGRDQTWTTSVCFWRPLIDMQYLHLQTVFGLIIRRWNIEFQHKKKLRLGMTAFNRTQPKKQKLKSNVALLCNLKSRALKKNVASSLKVFLLLYITPAGVYKEIVSVLAFCKLTFSVFLVKIVFKKTAF